MRKLMPLAVEGYHVPDQDMNPIDLWPKGIEIRTPVCPSIQECLDCLQVLHARLQVALGRIGYQAVASVASSDGGPVRGAAEQAAV